VYSARVLGAIDLGVVRAEGYGFQIEMVRQVLDHGGRVVEVPIRFVDRVEGESKMSMHIVVEAFVLVTWWRLSELSALCDPAVGPPVAAQHHLSDRELSCPAQEAAPVPEGPTRGWAVASAIIEGERCRPDPCGRR